ADENDILSALRRRGAQPFGGSAFLLAARRRGRFGLLHGLDLALEGGDLDALSAGRTLDERAGLDVLHAQDLLAVAAGKADHWRTPAPAPACRVAVPFRWSEVPSTSAAERQAHLPRRLRELRTRNQLLPPRSGGRVRGWRCRHPLPSEPDLKLSPHPAQALT